MFTDVYKSITDGTEWNKLEVSDAKLYPWDDKSTYFIIRRFKQ